MREDMEPSDTQFALTYEFVNHVTQHCLIGSVLSL